NFADCSPVAGRAGIREYLFGKACGLDNLAMFAALDYKRNPDKFQPEENNMYYRLQEIFTRKSILSEDTTAAIFHPPVFYSSVGLCIARNNIYTAAAKCGDNNDSHNHNDTGSITLYKNGQPLLVDIGVESYTKKTFSPQRYEIWTMQSDYHNLPTINGCMQQNGAEYRATDVSHSFNVEGGSISMDIAKAYPAKAHIETYNRSVSLTDTGLKLNDNWRFTDLESHPVTLNFITYEKPVLKDNALLIGELGQITFPANCSVQLEELPITDPRLMQCWKHSLYRIRISTIGNSTELFIS
ncbi:MAG: heparinase II/III family protein, partial [Lachnospiraceae bacterium]